MKTQDEKRDYPASRCHGRLAKLQSRMEALRQEREMLLSQLAASGRHMVLISGADRILREQANGPELIRYRASLIEAFNHERAAAAELHARIAKLTATERAVARATSRIATANRHYVYTRLWRGRRRARLPYRVARRTARMFQITRSSIEASHRGGSPQSVAQP